MPVIYQYSESRYRQNACGLAQSAFTKAGHHRREICMPAQYPMLMQNLQLAASQGNHAHYKRNSPSEMRASVHHQYIHLHIFEKPLHAALPQRPM